VWKKKPCPLKGVDKKKGIAGLRPLQEGGGFRKKYRGNLGGVRLEGPAQMVKKNTFIKQHNKNKTSKNV